MTVGITANLRHRSGCIPELARTRVQAVGGWPDVLQQRLAVVGFGEAITYAAEALVS